MSTISRAFSTADPFSDVIDEKRPVSLWPVLSFTHEILLIAVLCLTSHVWTSVCDRCSEQLAIEDARDEEFFRRPAKTFSTYQESLE